jgi:hypothetical protein
VKVPKNGSPVGINLANGGRTNGPNRLQIEAWTQDQSKDEQGRYPWRCRISIPGGGLVEREEQFAFEAPPAGYRESDEVVMEPNDTKWKKRFKKDYFAKLPDGTYARFQFEFTSGGEHFFMVESYLNPKPGSHNLEYDPEKQVNIGP